MRERANKTRDGMIWLLRGNGATLAELGVLFGITRERVRYICRLMDARIAVECLRSGRELGLPVTIGGDDALHALDIEYTLWETRW